MNYFDQKYYIHKNRLMEIFFINLKN